MDGDKTCNYLNTKRGQGTKDIKNLTIEYFIAPIKIKHLCLFMFHDETKFLQKKISNIITTKEKGV